MSKLRQTMIEKYGSEEAWKEHMRSIASKGGSKKFPGKGFANPNHNPSEAGSKGGKISRRKKKL